MPIAERLACSYLIYADTGAAVVHIKDVVDAIEGLQSHSKKGGLFGGGLVKLQDNPGSEDQVAVFDALSKKTTGRTPIMPLGEGLRNLASDVVAERLNGPWKLL